MRVGAAAPTYVKEPETLRQHRRLVHEDVGLVVVLHDEPVAPRDVEPAAEMVMGLAEGLLAGRAEPRWARQLGPRIFGAPNRVCGVLSSL